MFMLIIMIVKLSFRVNIAKLFFPRNNTIYENCSDLVHYDEWNVPCISRESKYHVTFIDEKSMYT